MLADKLGIRFEQFLECIKPLVDLPDPEQEEDAHGEAWEDLAERLEQASAEGIVDYVRERVTHAIETRQYDKGRELAGFAGMGDELRRIHQAQLGDIYERWRSTEDRKARRDLYGEFRGVDLQSVEDDPRVNELRSANALDDIREVYRFKHRVKSGEALSHALDILERSQINLRDLDSELFSQVHADAVNKVERVATADRWNPEEGARQARRLIERYLEDGILDFGHDTPLIDKFTRGQ